MQIPDCWDRRSLKINTRNIIETFFAELLLVSKTDKSNQPPKTVHCIAPPSLVLRP